MAVPVLEWFKLCKVAGDRQFPDKSKMICNLNWRNHRQAMEIYNINKYNELEYTMNLGVKLRKDGTKNDAMHVQHTSMAIELTCCHKCSADRNGHQYMMFYPV